MADTVMDGGLDGTVMMEVWIKGWLVLHRYACRFNSMRRSHKFGGLNISGGQTSSPRTRGPITTGRVY